MDELVNETVTESGKYARLTEKMTDIYDNCRERVLELEAGIIPPCLEIIKAYNQAMTNLFSQHRDTVETIMYE
ncbi:MAG: hypothetical protein WAM88_09160 [Nitrososphaeraceae archaeon]